MALVLNPPSTIGFERPLTRFVPQVLTLHNGNSAPCAFKVKTTAPKQYSVRPNAARVEPGETVEIHIVLQPLKEEPEAGAKSRDKFLVQSVLLTPERETVDLQAVWGMVPSNEVHEQKVRVAWLSEGSAAPSAGSEGNAATAAASSTNGAGVASAPAPAAGAGAGVGAGAGAVTGAGITSPASTTNAAPPTSSVPPTYAADLSRSLAATSPAGTTNYSDEKSALSGSSTNAEERIKSLQTQLAVANSERGVPVQTVAIISVAIFVLTYIFF